MSWSSWTRPTKRSSCAGRLRGRESVERRGGNVDASPGASDLEHVHRRLQVAQPVLAEVDELDADRQVSAHELGSRARDHELPTVRDRHEPCAPIQRVALVLVADDPSLAGVDTHPRPQRSDAAPVLGCQGPLRVDRGGDGGGRGSERGGHAITHVREDDASVSVNGLAQQLVVARDRCRHRLTIRFPASRRTLQISEEERDRPRRQLRHPAPVRVQWR